MELDVRLLEKIFTHVEDPVPLSRTSIFFHAVSVKTSWRAAWLIERYERHKVMFEAIARPEICTLELLECLKTLKVPLALNVVQLLHAAYGAGQRTRRFWAKANEDIRWGTSIRFPIYLKLMNWAHTTSVSFVEALIT